MKWKIILFMMVMLMLETVYAAPSISLDILSNDTYNTSNSIFNITLSGTECSGGNTSWWNSTGRQQILGLDFNINETDNNFWDYTNGRNSTCLGGKCSIFNLSCSMDGSPCLNTNMSIKLNDSDAFPSLTIGNYTFGIWVRTPYNQPGNPGLLYLGDASESNPSLQLYLMNNNQARLESYIYNGSETSEESVTLTQSGSLLNNTWYWIVGQTIYNSPTNYTMYLYINGVLNGSSSLDKFTTLSFFKNITRYNIANQKTGFGNRGFNGSIDDVRIYNYALSSQEVSELYNASVAKRSPRLLPQQTTNGDIWQASAVCSNRTAYSTRASEILYISDCITVLANTSYSSWLNISACDFYDHLSQSTNFTTYDTNNCGTFSNITYNLTQNASCDFCEDNQNISLCTYQTNEMEGRNMLFGLILIPLVLGIMFLVASFLMSEEHTIIKIFFFGLSFLSATASLYMGSVGITYIDPADTAVQAAIGNMMQWVSWVDYIILIYIFIFVTIHILKALKQDKEEKLKY